MSDLPLDGPTFEALARARGIPVEPGDAERLARLAGPPLAEFRRLAATLCADDDMLAFRRLLELEAAGG